MACPSPACRVPARLPACGSARTAPFGHFVRLALVPGHHVDLVDLHLAFERHLRRFGDQSAAQLLRHRMHVRSSQAQLACDLPAGKVQTHEVEAQHPHAQRLMVPGQHRAGQIVEVGRTGLAPVALPTRLRVVAPVPDHRGTAAPRAARTFRPAVLAHKGEALRVVYQSGKIDQVECRHDGRGSSRKPVGCSHSSHHIRRPPTAPPGSLPRNPTRAEP